VLQEILYRYAALRRLDLAGDVYDLFVQLCPVVFAVTLADTDRARAMLARSNAVGVRDAIHTAVMLNNDVTSIATFDAAFDRIPGISRLAL
jgi:predicted nucleic acid-binding protein